MPPPPEPPAEATRLSPAASASPPPEPPSQAAQPEEAAGPAEAAEAAEPDQADEAAQQEEPAWFEESAEAAGAAEPVEVIEGTEATPAATAGAGGVAALVEEQELEAITTATSSTEPYAAAAEVQQMEVSAMTTASTVPDAAVAKEQQLEDGRLDIPGPLEVQQPSLLLSSGTAAAQSALARRQDAMLAMFTPVGPHTANTGVDQQVLMQQQRQQQPHVPQQPGAGTPQGWQQQAGTPPAEAAPASAHGGGGWGSGTAPAASQDIPFCVLTPCTLGSMGFSVQNTFIHAAMPPPTPPAGASGRAHSLPRDMGSHRDAWGTATPSPRGRARSGSGDRGLARADDHAATPADEPPQQPGQTADGLGPCTARSPELLPR
uniref:Uncharacterized protein n=1 Tax=Alexandrium monilatum TaxID=311494 RepID=A0A7S4R8Z6_9DINO